MHCENEKIIAEYTKDGTIKIINKSSSEEYTLNLFGEDFQYKYEHWNVMPLLYLTENSQFLIVTYGIGYVYFISLESSTLVKCIKLFQDISYEDESYKKAVLCGYYDELTQVTFSPSGRYIEVRVRGDFDPQDTNGRDEISTPIYFRSVFLIDMETLEVCFEYDFGDVEEGYGRNAAVAAFSPDEKYFVTGALGNALKVFRISDKAGCSTPMSVCWIAAPLDIRDCDLVRFINNEKFIYIGENDEEKCAVLQSDGIWHG